MDRLLRGGGQRADRRCRAGSEPPRVDSTAAERNATGAEAGQVEDVAEQSLHPIGSAGDRRQEPLPLLVAGRERRVEEQADARAQRGERCPELVHDRREHVGTQALELRQTDECLGAGELGIRDALPQARGHVARLIALHAGRADEAQLGEAGQLAASPVDAQLQAAATRPLSHVPGEAARVVERRQDRHAEQVGGDGLGAPAVHDPRIPVRRSSGRRRHSRTPAAGPGPARGP